MFELCRKNRIIEVVDVLMDNPSAMIDQLPASVLLPWLVLQQSRVNEHVSNEIDEILQRYDDAVHVRKYSMVSLGAERNQWLYAGLGDPDATVIVRTFNKSDHSARIRIALTALHSSPKSLWALCTGRSSGRHAAWIIALHYHRVVDLRTVIGKLLNFPDSNVVAQVLVTVVVNNPFVFGVVMGVLVQTAQNAVANSKKVVESLCTSLVCLSRLSPQCRYSVRTAIEQSPSQSMPMLSLLLVLLENECDAAAADDDNGDGRDRVCRIILAYFDEARTARQFKRRLCHELTRELRDVSYRANIERFLLKLSDFSHVDGGVDSVATSILLRVLRVYCGYMRLMTTNETTTRLRLIFSVLNKRLRHNDGKGGGGGLNPSCFRGLVARWIVLNGGYCMDDMLETDIRQQFNDWSLCVSDMKPCPIEQCLVEVCTLSRRRDSLLSPWLCRQVQMDVMDIIHDVDPVADVLCDLLETRFNPADILVTYPITAHVIDTVCIYHMSSESGMDFAMVNGLRDDRCKRRLSAVEKWMCTQLVVNATPDTTASILRLSECCRVQRDWPELTACLRMTHALPAHIDIAVMRSVIALSILSMNNVSQWVKVLETPFMMHLAYIHRNPTVFGKFRQSIVHRYESQMPELAANASYDDKMFIDGYREQQLIASLPHSITEWLSWSRVASLPFFLDTWMHLTRTARHDDDRVITVDTAVYNPRCLVDIDAIVVCRDVQITRVFTRILRVFMLMARPVYEAHRSNANRARNHGEALLSYPSDVMSASGDAGAADDDDEIFLVCDIDDSPQLHLPIVQYAMIVLRLIQWCGDTAIPDVCAQHICSFIHNVFINTPSLIRTVLAHGYDVALIPMTVANIPSLHVCIDYIDAMVQQTGVYARDANVGRSAFAMHLLVFLSRKYRVERFLNACTVCVKYIQSIPDWRLVEFYAYTIKQRRTTPFDNDNDITISVRVFSDIANVFPMQRKQVYEVLTRLARILQAYRPNTPGCDWGLTPWQARELHHSLYKVLCE